MKVYSIFCRPSFQLLVAILLTSFSVVLDYLGYSIFSWPVDGAVVGIFVYRSNWPKLMHKIDLPFKQKTLTLLALFYFVFGTSFLSFVKMFSCPPWLFRTYFLYQIFSFILPILLIYLVKYAEVQHLRKGGFGKMIFIKGETSVLLLSFIMGLGEDFVSLVILSFALFQAALCIKQVSIHKYADKAGILVESYEKSFWRNLAMGEKHFGGVFHVAFLTTSFLFFFSLSMLDVKSTSQVITITLNAWILVAIYLIVKNKWSLSRSKILLVAPVAIIFILMTLEGSLEVSPITAFYTNMFFTENNHLSGEIVFGMSYIILLLVGAIWPLKPRKGETALPAPSITRFGLLREAFKKTLVLLIFAFFSLSYFIALMFALPKIPNAHIRTAITIGLSGFYVWLSLYKEVIPTP